MKKAKREPRPPRPQPIDLDKVSGGAGTSSTGGVHPNPPIGPGG